MSKPKSPNLGIIIDEEKKRKFASECKLRGLSMNEVLEDAIDRKLVEWNFIAGTTLKNTISKPDPPPLAATSEVKKCIICKDRTATPGLSTCDKCGGRKGTQ